MSADALDPLARQGPGDLPSPDPESWSADGGAPASKRPKRFIPFSFGARDCVGRSLATINYKMLLAVLLGNFRFCLAEEVTPRRSPSRMTHVLKCFRAQCMRSALRCPAMRSPRWHIAGVLHEGRPGAMAQRRSVPLPDLR